MAAVTPPPSVKPCAVVIVVPLPKKHHCRICFWLRGVGQVRAARNALRAVGDFPFPVMGVAKGPLRKVGEETLITESGEVMRWPASDPALHLIQEVRDEAHRFAVVGHRKRRDKKRGTSLLDCVDGIGRKKNGGN